MREASVSASTIRTTMREARNPFLRRGSMRLIASGVPKSLSVAIAVLVVGALSLSSCASTGIQGPGTSPSPTTTDHVALGSSVFDIGCEEVATAEQLTSVFGTEPTLSTVPRSGVRPTQIFATALEQDGA